MKKSLLIAVLLCAGPLALFLAPRYAYSAEGDSTNFRLRLCNFSYFRSDIDRYSDDFGDFLSTPDFPDHMYMLRNFGLSAKSYLQEGKAPFFLPIESIWYGSQKSFFFVYSPRNTYDYLAREHFLFNQSDYKKHYYTEKAFSFGMEFGGFISWKEYLILEVNVGIEEMSYFAHWTIPAASEDEEAEEIDNGGYFFGFSASVGLSLRLFTIQGKLRSRSFYATIMARDGTCFSTPTQFKIGISF